jgi:hypothetical protein
METLDLVSSTAMIDAPAGDPASSELQWGSVKPDMENAAHKT